MGYEYDDDDLIDYAGASDYEYDEDDLAVDIASVRSLLAGRSVSDHNIKEILEQTDYNIEKTAKLIRAQVDKEKEKQRSLQRKYIHDSSVKLSKFGVANAISEGQEGDNVNTAVTEERTKHIVGVEADTTNATTRTGGQSKLALLAMAKAKSSSSRTTPKHMVTQTKTETKPSVSSESSASSALKSVGLLNRISSKTGAGGLSSLRKPAGDSSIGASRLASLKKPDFGSQKRQLSQRNSNTESKPKRRIRLFPSIDYESADMVSQSLQLSLLGGIFDSISHYIPRYLPVTNLIYAPVDAEKVQAALAKESPDDIVLKAQQRGLGNGGGAPATTPATTKVTTSKTSAFKPKTQEVTTYSDEEALAGKTKDLTIADPLESLKSVSSTRKLDVSKEIAKFPPSTKPLISFVVIGHVDAGKSTLMGRLLYDCGAIDQHTIEKYKKDSGLLGKGSFAFAWVLDQTQEERNRGVTIDICVSSFETEKASFTIVDAPGHRDFVPNMIAGSSQADYAVLVVDADTNAFESGFNLNGQTKEHAILARSLGVERIIVAVNKLDVTGWSEERFNEIVDILGDYLTTKVGFTKDNIVFVPTSGLEGENVVNAPTNPSLLKWYKGPTLLQQLESNGGVTRQYNKPLRLIVSDVYSGQHSSGIMVHGRLDSGYVQVGETVVISPQIKVARVKGIKSNSGQIKEKDTGQVGMQWAAAGQNVILNLVDVTVDEVFVGDVISNVENPVLSYNKLQSKAIIFELERPVIQGAKMIFHRGRSNIPCKVSKILATLDKSTGQVLKKKPRILTSGQAALIEITLDEGKRIPLELYKENKQLGRFVLRQKGATLAAGVVDALL